MSGRLGEGPDAINSRGAARLRPEEVRRVLDLLRPGLLADGGNVELHTVQEDGTVIVELQGACARCPAAEMTRSQVLEPGLKARLSGVTSVLVR